MQKDLAILLGVNEMTIVNRELDRGKPAKRHAEKWGTLTRLGV